MAARVKLVTGRAWTRAILPPPGHNTAEGVVTDDSRAWLAKAASLCNGVTRLNPARWGRSVGGDGQWQHPPQFRRRSDDPQDGGARAENPLAPASIDG